MKKILIIPFILLCMMLFTVPLFAMQNEPDNFRGIPWGAKMPREIASGEFEWALKKVETNGLETTFHRLEKPSFAGLAIPNAINYIFHKRYGFVAARIEFSGRETFDLFAKACVEEWGKPKISVITPSVVEDCDFEMKLWAGKKVIIRLMYYYNQSQECYFTFYENKYFRKLLKEYKEQ